MFQFEFLANELLLNIFELLNTANLIHAFHGLNSRFNKLLYTHFQKHEINLNSISYDDFNVICREYIGKLTYRIISLRISNGLETPNIFNLFLSHGFTFNRFTHLKSLTLCFIDSIPTISQIIIQCRSLLYLNHFNLIDCFGEDPEDITMDVINTIWSLRKLTHFSINNLPRNTSWLFKLSVVSSSIKCVSVNRIPNGERMLYDLFKYTPCLQRLSIDNISWKSCYSPFETIFSSLISLKTHFEGHSSVVIHFLKRFPNLSYLSLEISNIHMNGNDWENLLANHLTKLKKFHLKMNFDDSIGLLINELVDSFRTPFWLEEHEWYVRCDCYSLYHNNYAVLYTLPYTFNQCLYLNADYSISTKPDDEEYSSCKHVEVFNQESNPIESFNDLNIFNIRFPNIRHMEITLPLIDEFERFNLSFNRLISLCVQLSTTFGYSHSQILLDQAHHLYLLAFKYFGESRQGLFELRSSSIRRLDLILSEFQGDSVFSHRDCMQLINSPLGRQCEVLQIEFKNRRDIIRIIERISNLRMLIFRYKGVISNYFGSPSIHRRFFHWLKRNLSSKSTIISLNGSHITLWISRQTNQSLSTTNDPLTHDGTIVLRQFCGTTLLICCFPCILIQLAREND